ncbi:MAG: diaminopimelate decarboxylase [Chromatiales bacterium]|nr:diaminopimelate decarboxylase [Chromatiales bacterium]
MDPFISHDGVLHAEGVALPALAERFGTPLYVYSRAALSTRFRAFDDALAGMDHRVCFAVKANSNLAVLDVLARLGAGFDIVSAGELARVLAAGGDPTRVVFSGVGKRREEIESAIAAGIDCFNVESAAELDTIAGVASTLGRSARIAIRVNPDVDARTHPYISTGLKENKFGVDHDTALALYRHAAGLPNVTPVGIACHIGSQLTDLAPFRAAIERVLAMVATLEDEGIRLEQIDLGGGLGVRYTDESPPTPTDYVRTLRAALGDRPQRLIIEPGRAIVANAGVLLTRVIAIKQTPARRFAIVDAAMNDLIRPALYDAVHTIEVVDSRAARATAHYEIVGPVCETGDFLGHDRELAISADDLLAIRSAGAYGFAMASNYNSRPRAAEVLVDGDVVHLARARETVESLYAAEHRLPADS